MQPSICLRAASHRQAGFPRARPRQEPRPQRPRLISPERVPSGAPFVAATAGSQPGRSVLQRGLSGKQPYNPVSLREAVAKASPVLQNETRFGGPSSGLPRVPGTTWHTPPRPSSSQTADLAPALCDITGSHREALTVSSPSSEPSCLCRMLLPRCRGSATPGFSLPGLQARGGSLAQPLTTQGSFVLTEVMINPRASV